MGEAKRRGTFEERKAQAIAEGREKRPLARWHWHEKLNALGERYREPVITLAGRLSFRVAMMAGMFAGPQRPNEQTIKVQTPNVGTIGHVNND